MRFQIPFVLCLPYLAGVFGQAGLSKQCRPRPNATFTIYNMKSKKVRISLLSLFTNIFSCNKQSRVYSKCPKILYNIVSSKMAYTCTPTYFKKRLHNKSMLGHKRME